MQFLISWLLSRLAEPSTFAGIAAASAAVSQMVQTGDTSSDLIGNAITGLAVAAGVVAGAVREKGGG